MTVAHIALPRLEPKRVVAISRRGLLAVEGLLQILVVELVLKRGETGDESPVTDHPLAAQQQVGELDLDIVDVGGTRQPAGRAAATGHEPTRRRAGDLAFTDRERMQREQGDADLVMVLALRLARMQVHHRREPIAMPRGEDAAVEVQALDGDRIDAAQNGPVVPKMVGRKPRYAIETHQHLVIAATPDMRTRAERRARRPRHDLRDA